MKHGTTRPPFLVQTRQGRDWYFMVDGHLHGPFEQSEGPSEYRKACEAGTVREKAPFGWETAGGPTD
jgi:hypothetical protein